MQQQAKGRIRGAERQSRDARLLQRAQALHPAAQTRKVHRVRCARLIAVGKARQVLRSVIVQAGSGPPGQGQRLAPAEPFCPKAAAVARRIVIVRQ